MVSWVGLVKGGVGKGKVRAAQMCLRALLQWRQSRMRRGGVPIKWTQK